MRTLAKFAFLHMNTSLCPASAHMLFSNKRGAVELVASFSPPHTHAQVTMMSAHGCRAQFFWGVAAGTNRNDSKTIRNTHRPKLALLSRMLYKTVLPHRMCYVRGLGIIIGQDGLGTCSHQFYIAYEYPPILTPPLNPAKNSILLN